MVSVIRKFENGCLPDIIQVMRIENVRMNLHHRGLHIIIFIVQGMIRCHSEWALPVPVLYYCSEMYAGAVVSTM